MLATARPSCSFVQQVDDGWTPQHSSPCCGGCGRKSTGSRFRFTETGIITSLGARCGRADRRRRMHSEERRNRKSLSGDNDGAVVVVSDAPETVSATKKSCRCRQRMTYGEGPKRPSTSELTGAEVDHLEPPQKTPPNRRRKQTSASKKKSASSADNSLSDDWTPKTEGGTSKRRANSRAAHGRLDANPKTPKSTVRSIYRPVFHRLPEPNRAWLLVVYFSR